MVNVSVVIKALNEESNIARAIESSLKAVAPYGGEVILADSGSADRTVDEAAAFPVTIVQLLRPEDRCCGVSQQLGYQHSRGEYVYLLDGDMELDANFLQRAIKLLDCEHSVAGVGGYIREMRIENHEFEHRSRRLIRGRRTHPAEVGYLNGGGLYRRAAVEDVRYLSDRNLHANEEYDLGVRLRAKGWRIIRLESHAADHYGHAMTSYRLLLHRATTGYILGSGEVLRAAIDGGYLRNVLVELRPLRAYGFAVALWVLALLTPLLPQSRAWGLAALFVLCALPIAAMTLRHRSFKLGLYSVVVWHVQGLGLIRGLFRKRRAPTDPIASRIIQTAHERHGGTLSAETQLGDHGFDTMGFCGTRGHKANDRSGVPSSEICRSAIPVTPSVSDECPEAAMPIRLTPAVYTQIRRCSIKSVITLLILAFAGLIATSALCQDAKPQQYQWQPVDLNEDYPIRGITYVPESAGHDWSIARAINIATDITRFEVRQGDQWAEDNASGDNKERSELDGYRRRWKDDDDIWGAYSFYIEPGRPYRSAWTGISQIHGSKVLSFHLHFENETLAIYTEYLANGPKASVTSTPHYAGKVLRAAWHNVVFHLKQGVGERGRLEFWLDGKKIVNFTGSIGATGNQAYWKYGIYRGYGPIATAFAIQFANMEIGTADLTSRITSPQPIE